MAKEIGRYDTDLQMFVEPPKPINVSRLLFQRWLAQNGRAEHFPEGPPSGEVAAAIVIKSNKPIEQAIREALRPRSIREQATTEVINGETTD